MRPLHSLRQDGMTLIEVLVTLVIISVGLLGVAALQLTTVRNNHDAFVRSQAAVLASDILDRMRANRLQALGYTDPNPSTSTPAGADVVQWRQTLAAQLRNGTGQIAFDGATQVVTVTITWGERSAIASEQTLVFRTSTQI